MLMRKSLRYLASNLPVGFVLRCRCLILSVCRSGKVQIGGGAYVHPSVHVLGKDNIRVGENTCVSEGSWLNVNHRDKGKVSIEIGNNCFIGKQNFFTSGDYIRIGDYTLTTIGCRFIGSSHQVGDPEVPYLLTGTTKDDRIIIGVNCFIGAGATVLGNVSVGHGSVVGANSLVLSDIPPFSLVVGNPAKVVKRYSFKQKTWLPAAQLPPEDESAMPSEGEYLARLAANYPKVGMPWIAAGKSMGDL